MNNTRNQGVLPVLLLAVLALATTRAHAQSDDVLSLDIETQDAGSALVKLATSSGMEIVLDGETGKNMEVEGLNGEYRIEEALAALLADTGLTYEFASESRIVVRQAQEPSNQGEEDEEDTRAEHAEEEEEPLELGEQRVTGSRMKGGDPTANVISFTAEDIARRGLSSTEEIFREMPWAFSSTTSQAGHVFAGPGDVDVNLGQFGLGLSTVNLRALGSENTLVLLNGRRIGGRGGRDSDVVNLMNIPLSAIERVDIELGAASAIYGADAVGGVVNFITRKRYTGLEATIRREHSATDAHRSEMSVRGGYSWGSGSMTATIARTESDPINNRKIWTSNDFRDQFGPEYDKRDYRSGQPGVVCKAIVGSLFFYQNPFCDWPVTYFQLSPGHSGAGATPEDFTTDISPNDYVVPYNGARSTTLSVTLRAEQYLRDNLMVFGEVLRSDHEAFREETTLLTSYLIPPSNAYNPFDHTVIVRYFPAREVAAGLFPPEVLDTRNIQRSYTGGAIWEFGANHELTVQLSYSEPKFSGQITDHSYRRGESDPTSEAFYRALESSDPNVALNPFGDGSLQGSDFSQFRHGSLRHKGSTALTSNEAVLRGTLFEVWGGPVNYVVGGELRVRKIRTRTVTSSNAVTGVTAGEEYSSWELDGFDGDPRFELRAGFVELGFPLVGERNARPGLRGLYLSLQARRDNYYFVGPAGGRETVRHYVDEARTAWVPGQGWVTEAGWITAEEGPPNITEFKKSDTTPRIGLRYKPIDSASVRLAWSQSFHPPNMGQQFDALPNWGGYQWIWDPLHPSGERTRVVAQALTWFYSPDVRSEYADKYSLNFEWEPEGVSGLRWTVDWSRIVFTDKIVNSRTLESLFPLTFFADPTLAERDADGHLLTINHILTNVASKVSELASMSLEYTFDTRFGTFSPELLYARPLEEYYKIVESADPAERIATVHGSDKYKINARVTWLWRNLAADLLIHHRPGYENDAVGNCAIVAGDCARVGQRLPALKLGSMTTFDLTLTYRFANGLRVRTGARNLFQREAPTIYRSYGYDVIRWDARSRVAFLELHWAM